jgi:amino acid permease
LISSVFGSSVLAVPFALAQCGYALGAACLVGCALLTQAGAWMLVECARRVAASETGASRVTLSQIAAKATPRLRHLPEVICLFWGRWIDGLMD